MATLRSVLLHLDASPRSAARTAIARRLALAHDATITALYAVTPTLYDMPYVLAAGAAEALPALQELDAQRRAAARAIFDRALGDLPTRAVWQELARPPLAAALARHALCADLLVLGQHDGNDAQRGVPADFVPSVVIASGRPALVVPYVGEFDRSAREPLIAWKATREAARAVLAALPLLRGAERVHVTASEADNDETDGATVADLERYLRLHGVTAPLRNHGPVDPDTPGEGLLSLAADCGADLLVMGCYGHSRARELVLGGATRTVLAAMTVPLLTAH